jgi:hypothetical protein
MLWRFVETQYLEGTDAETAAQQVHFSATDGSRRRRAFSVGKCC